MYLKVYYNRNKKWYATVSEVEEALALASLGLDLEVDDVLGHPSVNFADSATYADRQRVQQALRKAGFETE